MSAITLCSNMVDYSKMIGERILPFQFTLNLERSVLYPENDEHQIFYYDILGVGKDSAAYADLSHFLFGICSSITREDIVSIKVIIDNEVITPEWGTDVEIKTEEKPDTPTGCVGLKFDYGLDKVDGAMSVEIEMAKTYPVGPVNICLFGGDVTATGLSICGPSCSSGSPCSSVFYQNETVCVPITVTPFAHSGTARAICCGNPIVSTDGTCTGTKKSCSMTIKQTLCIEIPISFGADIDTEDAVVSCGDVTEKPCNCTTTPPETVVKANTPERSIFARR
ncbi:MAG: hypothetical protein PHS74_11305 [Lachnospiraceae bacterium]|nr:hypothetical protein [Lachnospiraceae bacterium]